MTVNDDIDARLRKIAREQNRTYKDVLNEALAQGIEALEVAEPREHYQVESAATHPEHDMRGLCVFFSMRPVQRDTSPRISTWPRLP